MPPAEASAPGGKGDPGEQDQPDRRGERRTVGANAAWRLSGGWEPGKGHGTGQAISDEARRAAEIARRGRAKTIGLPRPACQADPSAGCQPVRTRCRGWERAAGARAPRARVREEKRNQSDSRHSGSRNAPRHADASRWIRFPPHRVRPDPELDSRSPERRPCIRPFAPPCRLHRGRGRGRPGRPHGHGRAGPPAHPDRLLHRLSHRRRLPPRQPAQPRSTTAASATTTSTAAAPRNPYGARVEAAIGIYGSAAAAIPAHRERGLRRRRLQQQGRDRPHRDLLQHADLPRAQAEQPGHGAEHPRRRRDLALPDADDRRRRHAADGHRHVAERRRVVDRRRRCTRSRTPRPTTSA